MAKGVPAIILAAGASSRLRQPKALVKWKDESLVSRSTRILSESGCSAYNQIVLGLNYRSMLC